VSTLTERAHDLSALPSFDAFDRRYEAGAAQVVWTRLVADLETPVSVYLKLASERPFSFLLESVEGGASRGRYSVIGFQPDVVWRASGNQAEINRSPIKKPDAFQGDERSTLESLRALLQESRLDLPEDLPPMAAGVFGYMGYDTVRLIETLPSEKPDELGVPDAVLMRPTVIVIFDSVKDEISIVTPVRPQEDVDSKKAYKAALKRLKDVVRALDEPLPHNGALSTKKLVQPEPTSNTSPDEYKEMVARAKEFIRAGDIFQVVLSQRFSAPFALPSFALYRALRRTNPSPFLFHLDLGGFALVDRARKFSCACATAR
jgi:anthranilate synthase component 1